MNETDLEGRIARRGLAIYFTVLVAGSSFLQAKILTLGESVAKTPWLIVALMYMPAVASVIGRLALGEGFGDVSLRWGGREGTRTAFLGWLYPIGVGVVAYGVAWMAGLAEFKPPLPASSHLYVDSAATNLLGSFIVSTTLGVAVSGLSAFGEEIGWRGYMLTRLITVGVPKPVLVSALAWGLWHVPLILSGQYAAGSRPWLSALLFLIGIVAMGYLIAYLRLRSGSVWPAVIMHAAWNAIIQGTFDRATVGAPLAVGESGWLTGIVSVGIVSVVTRGAWTMLRRPSERLTMPCGRLASAATV